MKSSKLLILAIIPFVVFANWSYIDSLSHEISVDSLFDILDKLSGEEPYPSGYVSWNRFALLEGADSAATYIRDKLMAYGLDSVFYQTYTDTIRDIYAILYGDSIYTSQNVIAYKKGTIYSDTCIVIGAHYDNVSRPDSIINSKCPGVDDNGTGTAAIIEMARIIADLDTDYDVYLVCFSGEEIGLHGSSKFVSQFIRPRNLYIKVMINLDMLGYMDEESYETYFYAQPQFLLRFGKITIDSLTVNNALLISGTLADDESFESYGYRTCAFIEKDWPIYPGLHNIIDSVSYIDSSYYYDNTRAAFGFMYYSANSPDILKDVLVIDRGDSSINICWDMPIINDIEKYTIYYKKQFDSEFSTINLHRDSSNYTIDFLEIDSVYIISITVTDSQGYESFNSDPVYICPTYKPHPPCSLVISSDTSNIYLEFPFVESADIHHYNIYRKRVDSLYRIIGTTVDTCYTDSALSDTFLYYYKVTTVDNDSLESSDSEEKQMRLIKLFHYLLVLDETDNGVLTSDEHCDLYYDSLFEDYTHKLMDCDSISSIDITILGNYARTIVIDDDLTENKLHLTSIYDYIDNGGKFMIFGWNAGHVLASTDDNPAILDSNDAPWHVFGIDTYRYNTDPDMDYMYYDINGADTVRFSSSKLPRGSNGRLNYGGVFSLHSGLEYGYYHSSSGNVDFNNKPVMYTSNDSNMIVVNLPLFCTEYNSGKNLVNNVLSLWNLISGIDDKIDNHDIHVNINPVQYKNLSIFFSGLQGERIEYRIIDITGRYIENREIYIDTENKLLDISLPLVNGIYFIEIFSDNLIVRNKILFLR